jgi:hypothetical protein
MFRINYAFRIIDYDLRFIPLLVYSKNSSYDVKYVYGSVEIGGRII